MENRERDYMLGRRDESNSLSDPKIKQKFSYFRIWGGGEYTVYYLPSQRSWYFEGGSQISCVEELNKKLQDILNYEREHAGETK